MKNVVAGESGNDGGTSQAQARLRNGRQRGSPVRAQHSWNDPLFRRGNRDHRAGSYIFLVEALVEPDLVFTRRLKGACPDDLLVVP